MLPTDEVVELNPRVAAEVAALDAVGCDVQVGMALYTGELDLAEAFLDAVTANGLISGGQRAVVERTGSTVLVVSATGATINAAEDGARSETGL